MFICSNWEAVALTIHEAYRMNELDEVVGELHSIEEMEDSSLLVLIGQIPVLLPLEMASRLKEFQGKRIGILKLNGYQVRVL
jgi:hypothetical protein